MYQVEVDTDNPDEARFRAFSEVLADMHQWKPPDSKYLSIVFKPNMGGPVNFDGSVVTRDV
jgi:hypothetical protein